MKKNRYYAPIDALYPFKGLNTLDPSTMADPKHSPNCLNMINDKGIITKRRGYNALGSDLQELIQALPTYEAESGFLTCFAITSEHQYKYDIDSETWIECYNKMLDDCSVINTWNTVDVGKAAISIESAALKVIVDASAGVEKLVYTNDLEKDLTKGNALTFWIKSSIALNARDLCLVLSGTTTGNRTGDYVDCDVPALQVGVWTKVYVDADLSSMDEFLALGIFQEVDKGAFTFYIKDIKTVCQWSGDDETWIDFIEGTDDNGHYLFITNNVDSMIYWDGTCMSTYVPTPGGSLDGFKTCRAVAIYLGALVLGNLTVSDINYPNYVGYSSPGNFFDFTSVDSDLVLLDGIQGGIERLLIYGTALAIYGAGSIGIARFIEGAAGYVYDNIITGETRILGGRGVLNLGSYHALVMQDNIYLFDGTKNLIPIADHIYRTYITSLQVDQMETAFAFNDTFNKRAYFVLPRDNGKEFFALDYGDFTLQNLCWTVLEYTDSIKCFGFFSEDRSITWDSSAANIPWEVFALTWKECFVSPGFPFVVFGTESRVFALDNRTYQDNEVDVLGSWESIDFVVPTKTPEGYPTGLSENGRWNELEVELFGLGNVDVHYSIDRGRTWTFIETLVLEGISEKFKLNSFDVVSPCIRIKLSSYKYFSLTSWFRVWCGDGGI